MAKCKSIDYRDICDMVETITKMKGGKLRLVDVIDSLEKHMDVGINRAKVCKMLGNKIEEEVEQIGDVRRVITWVILPMQQDTA